MFDYIKGHIVRIAPKNIVVDNNGIGYAIFTPNPYDFKEGSDATIYIYNYVRAECFDLYGFESLGQRKLFIKLISVKGIGPKGALAILASGDSTKLEEAINSGDSKYLQKFPGVGPKASGQIILDLKGKLEEKTATNPKMEDVKDALLSLGYRNKELKKIDKFIIDNIDLPIGELVKQSLKKML
ncbi:MAG: Holliday junction branch migration protein RuvA [Bacilli bacterium]